MNIKMLKYLQNEEEIIPQDYDGSYELVTAVVNAYRDVPPMTLDYQDLNTVYLMCIGTWRHGYEKKKEQLRNSHLSKENQEMLCKLVERLKAESAVGKYACKGSYIGHDTDMGMFGSGFFSFQNKTNDQSVRDFIAMCIDLLDMTDDEEMFQRAEGVLDKTFKGMRASSASVVLHCLKPNTFPIINGNAGNESVFTALDIPLKKPALLENYIPNCRKIKEFRDQNVTFKNYRVMDIAMWETTHSSAPIKKLIANYKENFQKWIPEELYKWQAVYCFRKNWDIHAENFAQMLKESLKEASILLDTGYEYPKKMMLQFAERDPEAVREMYRKLFEESHDLTTRVRDFQNSTEKLWIQYGFQAAGKQHYQSERTICRYLFFYNPEKYYLFQPEKLIRVAEQIGYDLDYQNKDAENINIYNDMADMFLREVEQDENLIEMLRQELTDFCYEDEKLHLLTDDIIWFAYRKQLEQKNQVKEEKQDMHFSKNTILYGPPGTGKTYHTALYAVAIIEGKALEAVETEDYSKVVQRYRAYKKEGRIEFTTFHQSYGYEDFVEGIRPVFEDEADDRADASAIHYRVEPGVFQKFCDTALKSSITGREEYQLNENPAIWKVSLEGTGDNETRRECMENGHIRIGWDDYGEDLSTLKDYYQGGSRVLNAFYNRMEIGDLVFSCYSATQIDAIGVIIGNPEWDNTKKQYKRTRKVHWIAKNLSENIREINGGHAMVQGAVYELWRISLEDAYKLIEKHSTHKKQDEVLPEKPYVFIIDEINRGNISKIFGELITLMEGNKRIGAEEETRVRLPYSNRLFGVPKNVYIIGTMNTADRSIMALDTALRRRFRFEEMLPDPKTVLNGVIIEQDGFCIEVDRLLKRMNERIEALYDREHTIGHAYFTPLKDRPEMDLLAEIFKDQVIPLLQEYFFDDYEKIRLVLGDNQKQSGDGTEFITVQKDDYQELFGSYDVQQEAKTRYMIDWQAVKKAESYRFLC